MGPLIWGGEWDHALAGREYAGSLPGRRHIADLCTELALDTATTHLPHCQPGLLSIDHIAVPAPWKVDGQRRIVAQHEGRRLSDHDAYLIDVTMPG